MIFGVSRNIKMLLFFLESIYRATTALTRLNQFNIRCFPNFEYILFDCPYIKIKNKPAIYTHTYSITMNYVCTLSIHARTGKDTMAQRQSNRTNPMWGDIVLAYRITDTNQTYILLRCQALSITVKSLLHMCSTLYVV